jgi:hypothetical protein
MRDLMTDLLLQDLENPISEGRMRTLSKEKREMLGEEEVPAEERAIHWLHLSSWAGSLRKVKQIRSSLWS